jgi:hypothetical protein
MVMRGQLLQDCITESTTYWGGLLAKLVDFTLKKRHLIGKLSEVIFLDIRNGSVLARLTGQRSAR